MTRLLSIDEQVSRRIPARSIYSLPWDEFVLSGTVLAVLHRTQKMKGNERGEI